MIKTLKNMAVVGLSGVAQAAVVFLKGVLLARILGVREFGFCVILLSVLGALDIFADAGIDRFVVQHRFGYRHDVLTTSHTFRVFGSAIVGAGIALGAFPLTHLFHSERLLLPLMATAGVITIRGFVNLGYKIQQRDHNFEKETIIDLTRFTSDIVISVLIAILTHNFIAALVGAYANALTQVAMSHLLSRGRRYAIRPVKRVVGIVSRFSVPIYVNATVLFAAMQGDRMVVASLFSKADVAIYAVSCTLGQGLTSLIGKVAERLLLPILAKRQNRVSGSQIKNNDLIGMTFISGSWGFQLFMSTLGPLAIRLIYGHSYSNISALVIAASVFQMAQIQQSWLNSILMANGATRALPVITFTRSAALPLAIGLVLSGSGLLCVPIAFAVGAALSLMVSFMYVDRLNVISGWLIFVSLVEIFTSIAFLWVIFIP